MPRVTHVQRFALLTAIILEYVNPDQINWDNVAGRYPGKITAEALKNMWGDHFNVTVDDTDDDTPVEEDIEKNDQRGPEHPAQKKLKVEVVDEEEVEERKVEKRGPGHALQKKIRVEVEDEDEDDDKVVEKEKVAKRGPGRPKKVVRGAQKGNNTEDLASKEPLRSAR